MNLPASPPSSPTPPTCASAPGTVMQQAPPDTIGHITLLGSHLPRRCGIATFTSDLTNAIAAEFPAMRCDVMAMNDHGADYVYPQRVRFEVADNDLTSYRQAADYLNVGATDVLSVQHEYGIFGGKAGSHVLELLRELRMPIVTTLHTIVQDPTVEQRRVMDQITRLSTRLVVMSQIGAALMRDVHNVPASKIDIIPHGVPGPPSTAASKARLGLEGRLVILTFGLLSPDKGIEHMIEALPRIVESHPDAIYVVLGATHPHVKERSGDSYRSGLERLAHRLGVEANIVFHDRFVSLPELVEFLSLADIYVTPYLNSEQITSGTLAYAVGAGKAVVSTPYHYARELLADERGILVASRNSDALAEAINGLLSDPDARAAYGVRAARHGRDMLWSSVARRHVESMERARLEQTTARRSVFRARTLAARSTELPSLNLDHLRAMTDTTGLLQHAAFSIPRYEDGYCVDDNARALLLTALLEDAGSEDPRATRALASRYLAFVRHAFNPYVGRFRNFMSYTREWSRPFGSEDSHGRALWAVGAVVGLSQQPGWQSVAGQLFQDALPASGSFWSSRGVAFSLLGIDMYQRAFAGDRGVGALQALLSARLLTMFEERTGPDWLWCDDAVTYDNARLPQALIVSGHRMGNDTVVSAGLNALAWLADIQRSDDGYFSPVGSNGFYPRHGKRALFDQQPIEACAMVSACFDAWRITHEERWATEMSRAFRWFLGENVRQASPYDLTSGGCRDGLHADRMNQNQGAESTLSFLLARTDMAQLAAARRLQEAAPLAPGSIARQRAAQ